MDIQGISAITNNQTSYASQGQSASDNSSSGGWKYLTVKEGGRVYTYLVIGKNMKILIGESADDSEDKDKQSADSNKKAGQATDPAGAAGSNAAENKTMAVGKPKEQQTDFLRNTEMLALTGYYQAQMRRTMQQVSAAVGNYDDEEKIVAAGQSEASRETV